MQALWRCRTTPRRRNLQLDSHRPTDYPPLPAIDGARKDRRPSLDAKHGAAMKNLTESDGRKRVIIEGVYPAIDAGRFPAKRTLGDQVRVEADIFTDGHDSISASLLVHRKGPDPASAHWLEVPMVPLVNDRWTASFRVGDLGRYGFKIQG